MKINWGWGLTIFLLCFITAMLSFVFFTTTQQVNLVEKDYYPKGVNYQTMIDRTNNANTLSKKIEITQQQETLLITFPEEVMGTEVEGNLLFAHIEDYKLDYDVALHLSEEGKQFIQTDSLKRGRYILKANWKLKGVDYYQELHFRVN